LGELAERRKVSLTDSYYTTVWDSWVKEHLFPLSPGGRESERGGDSQRMDFILELSSFFSG
jgi:hypothetical protein